MWVPDLRSLDKLLEVGVSPYLVFTLNLSVFRCFGWFEAVRGSLIGPKTWDRIVGISLRFFLLAVTVQKLVGCLCGNFALKCMFELKKAGNGQFDRSQNMGPKFGNFF